MASDSASMKLLIDNQSKRVLFAEANKPCVDFLFYILSLPVAKIVRLLKKQETLRPWKKLYESLENLNDSYIQSSQSKETLLKPAPPLIGYSVSPLLVLNDEIERRKFYTCECCYTLSDDHGSYCSNCYTKTTVNLHYKSLPELDHVGFVNDEFTYMVMDDLEIKPMPNLSSISNMILLKKLNVKNLDSLEEKVVNIGTYEALKLLKATLLSEKVLTRVFLEGDCCESLFKDLFDSE